MKKYSICFFLVTLFCFAVLALTYQPEEPAEETVIFREWTPPETHAWVRATLPQEHLAAEATVAPETEPETEAPAYRVRLTEEGLEVCYPDEDTVFKRVPLALEDLSPWDREELEGGLELATEEELYHYLESITS